MKNLDDSVSKLNGKKERSLGSQMYLEREETFQKLWNFQLKPKLRCLNLKKGNGNINRDDMVPGEEEGEEVL